MNHDDQLVGPAPYYQRHIFVCNNQKAEGKVCCANQGGTAFFEYLKDKLRALDVIGVGKTRVSLSGCLGRCSQGPCLVIYPEGIWYRYDTFADVDEIIETYCFKGQIVERLVLTEN